MSIRPKTSVDPSNKYGAIRTSKHKDRSKPYPLPGKSPSQSTQGSRPLNNRVKSISDLPTGLESAGPEAESKESAKLYRPNRKLRIQSKSNPDPSLAENPSPMTILSRSLNDTSLPKQSDAPLSSTRSIHKFDAGVRDEN